MARKKKSDDRVVKVNSIIDLKGRRVWMLWVDGRHVMSSFKKQDIDDAIARV